MALVQENWRNVLCSVPALYEKYVNTSTPAFDEWDLTTNMKADGSISDLENHYKTFIVSSIDSVMDGAILSDYWFVRRPRRTLLISQLLV